MKLGMIDGSLPKPLSTSNHYALWSRYHDIVLSWLPNSMTTEICNSVAYFSTAKEIWDDLAVRFSQSNMPRVFHLRKELSSLTQGSMSITAYFTKFCTLLAEIDTLNPMPKCICASCNCACNNAKKLDNYANMLKLSQFLMGLSDEYTSVRGQLLMMQPMSSLSQVFSLLLQEESQRGFAKIGQSPLADSMALTVKYNNLSKFRNNTGHQSGSQKKANTDVVCDYCHTTGHSRDKYFCLHGYPDWHMLYGKPKPKPRKNVSAVVKSAAQVSTISHSSEVSIDNSEKPIMLFTDAQCQQLSKMIQDSLRQTNTWNTNSSAAQMNGPYFKEGERDW
ncbi:uncharacterized protein LOC141668129 [Apium graveolens]|uniref:uncharacterized protein LOC141668129 n=1 Tax=Apium graveolens TaxID=4045 RepID=UPI003D7B0FB7